MLNRDSRQEQYKNIIYHQYFLVDLEIPVNTITQEKKFTGTKLTQKISSLHRDKK